MTEGQVRICDVLVELEAGARGKPPSGSKGSASWSSAPAPSLGDLATIAAQGFDRPLPTGCGPSSTVIT